MTNKNFPKIRNLWDILNIRRRSGAGDLEKIKVLVNDVSIKEADASTLFELSDMEIDLNMNSGDEIKIAAVLDDRRVCDIADSEIA